MHTLITGEFYAATRRSDEDSGIYLVDGLLTIEE